MYMSITFSNGYSLVNQIVLKLIACMLFTGLIRANFFNPVRGSNFINYCCSCETALSKWIGILQQRCDILNIIVYTTIKF